MYVKRSIPFFMSVLTAVLCVVAIPPTRADFSLSQAQQAVNAFNSLNEGRGYYYNVSPDNGRFSLTTVQGGEQADLGAYSPLLGGGNMLKTFCVEPAVETATKQYGTLNYANNSTTTTSGDKLTVGAAYLYASFATGMLAGYAYDSPNYTNGKELSNAMHFLMDVYFLESPWVNWSNNDFLNGLLDVNSDKSFWEQAYDPGRYYEEIGDYSVFVMNNQDEYGSHRQDFLYLAGYDGQSSTVTPEPASLLILGVGMAGVFCVYRARKKQGTSRRDAGLC